MKYIPMNSGFGASASSDLWLKGSEGVQPVSNVERHATEDNSLDESGNTDKSPASP